MKHFQPPVPHEGKAVAAVRLLGPIRLALAIIFVGGLALRLVMIPRAGIYHPDELFQYLEQSHRLLFGNGMVPWEYRYGMRSWLLPLLISGPMAVGDWIAPHSALYLLLPRAGAVLLSMAVVWSAWIFGRRHSMTHGLIAAAVMAFWAEQVQNAPQLLTETFSLALILPSAALLAQEASLRRTLLAGFLLGMAAILRMQYLPAIGVVALATAVRHPRDIAPLLIGGAIAIVLGAIVDIAMGQIPYGWMAEYFRQNIVLHRAENYGIAAIWAYPISVAATSGWWIAAILPLAMIGMRAEPTLARMALVNLLIHMAIGHKEYRFILLTTASLTLLAALGSATLVATAVRFRPTLRIAAPAAALLAWATASAALAASDRVDRYKMHDRRGLQLATMLRNDPELCALGTQSLDFTETGGYAYLHRSVPIYSYAPWEKPTMVAQSRGFNRLMAPAYEPPPPGFRRVACSLAIDNHLAACVFARPGRCAQIPQHAEINRTLARLDK